MERRMANSDRRLVCAFRRIGLYEEHDVDRVITYMLSYVLEPVPGQGVCPEDIDQPGRVQAGGCPEQISAYRYRYWVHVLLLSETRAVTDRSQLAQGVILSAPGKTVTGNPAVIGRRGARHPEGFTGKGNGGSDKADDKECGEKGGSNDGLHCISLVPAALLTA
jgi:hypothetical protein